MYKEPTVYQLDNGMRVSYLHVGDIVAHLGVLIQGGSRFEYKGEEGLAHFLEHCIFKGTKKRKAYHVISRLDSVGGELNAFTTKEDICVYGSFTVEHFNRTSDIIADIIFNSTFPAKEIEKEKEVILDEINSYLDSPGEKIFDDFESYIFPNHPLGNNILGTVESVKSFTSENLINYVNRFFYPQNMVLSFVGDLSAEKVLKQLNKDFGQLQKEAKKQINKKPKPISSFQYEVPDANYQCHIMIGGRAPSFVNKGRQAFTLLINLLGGPALNSLLGLAIREKYGYTYNIEAGYTPFEDSGYWNIYASTDAKYQQKTINLIHKVIQKLIDVPLSERQLNQAKNQLKGNFALSMDSNVGLMLSFGKSLLVFSKIDSLAQIYEEIEKITPKDIQKVAQQYLNFENRSALVFTEQKES